MYSNVIILEPKQNEKCIDFEMSCYKQKRLYVHRNYRHFLRAILLECNFSKFTKVFGKTVKCAGNS